MSKKIAQLTKVIYHLNTSNEDNQFLLSSQSRSHAAEIASIIKDAGTKINRFRDLVEEKKDEINLEAKLEQLKVKHEEEVSK